MKNGIAIAGTIAVDYNKIINQYPSKGMLSNILSMTKGIGGCVPNTIIDLAKIEAEIPLYAYGGIGDDENGEYIIKTLKENGIDSKGIVKYQSELTAFTDAMILEATGERTFFTAKGANNAYSFDDIDFASIKADMFHMGYIFLMDPFDKEDKEYGTVLAKALARVQAKGIKTSIDLVSVEEERFSEIVMPSLKYCNYFIVNEIEAGKTVNISPYNSEGIIEEHCIIEICNKILEAGVQDLVVIHAPEGGWAMTSDKEFYFAPSLQLPQGYIKGSVGAGDAFCAGLLYSIYKELPMKESLEIACAAAASSLSEVKSTSGIKSIEELKMLYEKYKPTMKSN